MTSFSSENFLYESPKSSIVPMLQWFIFIFVVSLILYVSRKIAQRKKQEVQLNRAEVKAVTNYMYSFINAMAVILGTALGKFGNSRTECWFLVSFSMFGLLFRIVYTDNLFSMFATSTSHCISSIDQMIAANISMSVDRTVGDVFDVRFRNVSEFISWYFWISIISRKRK